MMPLSMTRSGETVSIKKISGRDKAKRHLENLGFCEGEDIIVVSQIAGNIILNVKGVRVAIDRAMANRILI